MYLQVYGMLRFNPVILFCFLSENYIIVVNHEDDK